MLIERLRVEGLLSFGPDGIDLPLEPLNVIIGPNGSGKSNLLDVFGLLRASASGWDEYFSAVGNLNDWTWKGPPHSHSTRLAQPLGPDIAATIALPQHHGSIVHMMGLIAHETVEVFEEAVRLVNPSSGISIEIFDSSSLPFPEHFNQYQSIMSQVDCLPDSEELHWVRGQYAGIRLYRNWTFGSFASLRMGNNAELKNDLLDENNDNLANVVSQFSPSRRETLTDYLKKFYEGIVGISTPVSGGKVCVVVEESHGRQIPAARLSDGTLRYLSLLTILLDPNPPPLIGIEEPELGLHPDMVFELGKLLVEASTRTQLVVTTHSPTLIDALTDHPSSVVVCEKYQGQTNFKRVNPEALEAWQDEPGLADIWSAGGIGGNRW